jgi:hypothetical protein
MNQPLPQRVIVVVGAGRSGTSTLTRGMAALGIELGDNLKPGSRKNPKGFFEDLDILDINQRLHRVFGLTTTGSDVRPEDQHRFSCGEVTALHDEAVALMRRRFGRFPLWGFKSGGVLRLLPFWERVFATLEIEPSYVVALRHPVSVARSRARLNPLRGRQEKSDLEWLSRMVPYFHLLRDHPLAVVDYDRLMESPEQELSRVAAHLALPLDDDSRRGMREFAEAFVTPGLRHHRGPAPADMTGVNPLTATAYRHLQGLATDRRSPADPQFWADWLEVETSFLHLGPALRHIDYLEAKLRRQHWGADDALRILGRRVKSAARPSLRNAGIAGTGR